MGKTAMPNVVWFCTDQQRWDTIHSLGNPHIRTPNLDRLAAEGTAFTRAYVQCPTCTPSRSSFLTGRYPRTTKAFFNGNDTYSKDETLVTRFLADRGYTCGLTGKLHLTSAQGRMEKRTGDGYSYMKWSHHPYDDWPNGENEYQAWLSRKGVKWDDIYGGRYPRLSLRPKVQNPRYTGSDDGVPAEYHQTAWCVEEAVNFIEQCRKKGNAPWLISVNPFDPHPPLDPPREYKDRLSIDDMPLPLRKDGEMKRKPPHQQRDYEIGGQNGAAPPIASLTDQQIREKTRDYYAQIELIDDQLGRLLDYLDSTGQRDNTMVIFMSDHGEMGGDHGLYWKGAYFYEGVVHVPLIISWPSRIKAGLVSSALVEMVDIAPTLAEAAGFEVPEYMQGKSLMPLLSGQVSADHHKDLVYSEFYRCLKGCHEDIFATMCFDGRYKIVNYHGKETGELYDFETDPHEFENLWDDENYGEIKTALTRKNFDNALLCSMDFSMGMKFMY
ncbi:sulfatase-like hydrolase/transferase [Treponema sp. OttesenSCG-928-L16]|nr:sulfatase-like hydrolase/transferase [Treponema sp. OttesenSCG-928-L16]